MKPVHIPVVNHVARRDSCATTLRRLFPHSVCEFRSINETEHSFGSPPSEESPTQPPSFRSIGESYSPTESSIDFHLESLGVVALVLVSAWSLVELMLALAASPLR